MSKPLTLNYINESFEVEDSVPALAAANFFGKVSELGYKNLSDIKEYNVAIFKKDVKVDAVYKLEKDSKDLIKVDLEEYQAILVKPALDFLYMKVLHHSIMK